MKGLESIIDLHLTSMWLGPEGWFFSGDHGSPPADPLYGFKTLAELYRKADPSYAGRITVPVLWDKKTHAIVNNESAEIARMLYTEFDEFLPEEDREPNRPGGGFYPEGLRSQIDEINEWMFRDINLGVYKTGLATTQAAYNANIYPLFSSLDKLEERLASATEDKPYLFGGHITEPDVRLFTTLIRFDVAYYTVFLCNLKMVRHDYPNLYLWMRRLYWHNGEETRGAFRSTTEKWMGLYARAYVGAKAKKLGGEVGVVPGGPKVLIDEL